MFLRQTKSFKPFNPSSPYILLLQDTKLWDRGLSHKPSHPQLLEHPAPGAYRGLNGALPSGSSAYAPHQYFPPRMIYPGPPHPSYNPRLQFMAGPAYRGLAPGLQMAGGYLGPPSYRHPPPVQIHSGPGGRDMEVSDAPSIWRGLSGHTCHKYTLCWESCSDVEERCGTCYELTGSLVIHPSQHLNLNIYNMALNTKLHFTQF